MPTRLCRRLQVDAIDARNDDRAVDGASARVDQISLPPAYSASFSTTITVNGVTTLSQSSTGSECASLANRLSGIDADARRPHPLPHVDRLRTLRQEVRDQQAAIHC